MNQNICSTLSDIATADFDIIDEVIGAASQTIEKAHELGLFMSKSSRQSSEAISLIGETTVWINNVKRRIDSYSAADALRLADLFDFMHRIASQRPADTTFINRIILRAFDARIHGDKTVDEYILYRAIRAAVNRRDKAFLGRPLDWLCISEEQWYNEASLGYEHTTLSAYDIINRTSILLESDLFVYEGLNQMEFKRQLAENTRRYLDNPDANDTKMRFGVGLYRKAASGITANVVAL